MTAAPRTWATQRQHAPQLVEAECDDSLVLEFRRVLGAPQVSFRYVKDVCHEIVMPTLEIE